MSDPELELLEARISEGQAALRDLHSQKRLRSVAMTRVAIEQAAFEASQQGLDMAVVQTGMPVARTTAGLPTSTSQVDMARASPVLVNTQLSHAQEEPPPVLQLSPRDQLFLEGALSSSSGQRGPQLVSLFPRKRG